jgi:peptidoglycan/LPS O-acetylase OafA/YrhL
MTQHKQPDLGNFGDWFRQLILLNAWVPARAEWNVPSWSISAEAFAYLLFPLVVAAYAAGPRLTQIAILVGALSFYILIGRSLDITVGLAPLRCIAGFGLGMLLFFHRERSRQLPWVSVLQFAAAIWIVFALIFPMPDPLIIPPFAVLVFLTWEDRGIVAKLLSTKPLHWLGDISYSVYLMHVPVGTAVGFVWLRVERALGLDDVLSRILLLGIVFASVLTVSSLTYRYVEKPCQRALRRRRSRTEDTFAAAPSAP